MMAFSQSAQASLKKVSDVLAVEASGGYACSLSKI
jgi:hypothetical protein